MSKTQHSTAAQRALAPAAWLFQLLLLLAAFALALPALAQQQSQADPPGRVARLNLAEGALSFAPSGTDQWAAAPNNRPLTDGDRLWAPERARAELDTGNALVRMDGQTNLILTEIDDDTVQLQLTQGSLRIRISGLYDGDRFEVDTPNLAFVASHAGEYRIDVDTARGATRVWVISGGATVYGENGGSAEINSAQQIAFKGRNLDPQAGWSSAGSDSFDHWVEARNRTVDQSQTARYVAPGTVGYQQLDQHGSWQTDSSYGPVWYPNSVPAGWAPYRYGQWTYIEPWGWTWVDDAPWGFAPFHYGRWVQSGSRWGWVPGPVSSRAYYSPALVAFGGNGNVHWQIGAGAAAAATWFPLAPGEPWRPGYRASDRYIGHVNRGIDGWDGRRWPDRHAHGRGQGAMTSIDGGGWDQRRPVRVHPPGAGFEPPRTPFALPPPEIRGPWPGREQLPRDPLRARQDDGRRGRFGDRTIDPVQPMAPAIGSAPTLPRREPQLPIQRQVVRDWERYQQQEAQQAQRQFGDQQRGLITDSRQDQFRQQQQEESRRAQWRQQQDQQRQQDQYRQQQDYQRQLQTQQQQQRAQQQQQRAQQEQQRAQQEQQQRAQQEQWRNQQQDNRNQAQQRQMQNRGVREHDAYQRQEERARQIRDQQSRGQVPP